MSLALQQFEGRSVEDALAAAARQLGEGLQVKSAQRIRRGGLLGFFAREHYQVIAESKPETHLPPHQPQQPPHQPQPQPQPTALSGAAAAPADDGLDRMLRSLVEEVEAREDAATVTRGPSRFTEADLVRLDPPPALALPAAVEQVDRPLRARPVKETAALGAGDSSGAVIDLCVDGVPTFYDFEVLDAQEIERAPKWTRTALRDLGLPPSVLKALPQRTPTSDIAWTRALERAIAKVVPPPAALDEEHDAQISGFGGKGAVNIIRASVSGFTPGLLQIDGRSVPATAAELALGVRSCLRR